MVLPIKKKWFDMILAGIKKEEYREIKPYYTKRFQKLFAPYYLDRDGFWDRMWFEECRCGWFSDETAKIILRNGYSSSAPTVTVEAGLRIGNGNTEWGADERKEYYILEIRNTVQNKELEVQATDNRSSEQKA